MRYLLPFAYPLGASLIVAVVGFALSFTGWRRIGYVLLGLALVALWVSATPIFANWLTHRLESRFPPVSVENLPRADAVIVLGGVLGQPFPPLMAADLSGAADRIMHALRIYHAGKASIIVVSAGNQPWQRGLIPEAQLIADLLIELGAPRSALILETESRNTRENASRTAAIFNEHSWQKGLLVTSGAHMPRALKAFQNVGLAVTPAATDVHARHLQSFSLLGLLPNAEALKATTSAIREMIALYVYRYRGWA